MKDLIWTESLLKAYARLENYIEMINKRVNALALTTPSVQYGTTTEVIADKIFKLIDKKKIMIKTKYLIDEILMQINQKYATVLKMFFVQNKSKEQVAEYFEVSKRTISRYMIEGINYFKKMIKQREETKDETLPSLFKKETWMASIYYDNVRKKLWHTNRTLYKKFVKDCDFKKLKDYEKFYAYAI